MTGSGPNLLLLAAVGLTVGGCRGGTTMSDKRSGDTNPPGHDTGEGAVDPRPVVWNEVAIEVNGQGAAVDVVFRASYDLSGSEGWGDNLRVKYESFYAAGYGAPIKLDQFVGQDHCRSELARLPESTMDLGRRLPFTLGDESLSARRSQTDDGFVEYYWERPMRDEQQFTVGDVISVLETVGPAVPPPVELTEPWAWEGRRGTVFADQALRIGWEPGNHPDDYVHVRLTLSSAEAPDSEGSATTYFCRLEDDGGVVLTGAVALSSPDQLLYSLDLVRERFVMQSVEGVGPVAFATAASTSLDVDPFPSGAINRGRAQQRPTAPASLRSGTPPSIYE